MMENRLHWLYAFADDSHHEKRFVFKNNETKPEASEPEPDSAEASDKPERLEQWFKTLEDLGSENGEEKEGMETSKKIQEIINGHLMNANTDYEKYAEAVFSEAVAEFEKLRPVLSVEDQAILNTKVQLSALKELLPSTPADIVIVGVDKKIISEEAARFVMERGQRRRRRGRGPEAAEAQRMSADEMAMMMRHSRQKAAMYRHHLAAARRRAGFSEIQHEYYLKKIQEQQMQTVRLKQQFENEFGPYQDYLAMKQAESRRVVDEALARSRAMRAQREAQQPQHNLDFDPLLLTVDKTPRNMQRLRHIRRERAAREFELRQSNVDSFGTRSSSNRYVMSYQAEQQKNYADERWTAPQYNVPSNVDRGTSAAPAENRFNKLDSEVDELLALDPEAYKAALDWITKKQSSGDGPQYQKLYWKQFQDMLKEIREGTVQGDEVNDRYYKEMEKEKKNNEIAALVTETIKKSEGFRVGDTILITYKDTGGHFHQYEYNHASPIGAGTEAKAEQLHGELGIVVEETRLGNARLENNKPIASELALHFRKPGTFTIQGNNFNKTIRVDATEEQMEGSDKIRVVPDVEKIDYSDKDTFKKLVGRRIAWPEEDEWPGSTHGRKIEIFFNGSDRREDSIIVDLKYLSTDGTKINLPNGVSVTRETKNKFLVEFFEEGNFKVIPLTASVRHVKDKETIQWFKVEKEDSKE